MSRFLRVSTMLVGIYLRSSGHKKEVRGRREKKKKKRRLIAIKPPIRSPPRRVTSRLLCSARRQASFIYFGAVRWRWTLTSRHLPISVASYCAAKEVRNDDPDDWPQLLTKYTVYGDVVRRRTPTQGPDSDYIRTTEYLYAADQHACRVCERCGRLMCVLRTYGSSRCSTAVFEIPHSP
ncbi:hypothetical protein GGR55DRAFT_562288 [Xylaria sp. FL0064]|nr:hypothetical protein GGR55DRAFT_562288 [Xylaria sp. FL0064]